METISMYPGTFDPVTNGHVDLVERASRIFDRVIVAVAEYPGKTLLFNLEERIELIQYATKDFGNVEVIGFDDLLIHASKRYGASILIRGLRAVSDFEYEFQLASANRRLAPEMETVFLTPSEANNFTSSSLVKEIASYQGDVSSFVCAEVLQALNDKYPRQSEQESS
jgi:pantetheine-phosphate adenylyltransferase